MDAIALLPEGSQSAQANLLCGAAEEAEGQMLRKSAFGCWFGCASLNGAGRPLDPSRLGLWVLRAAPHGLVRPQTIHLPFQLRAT